MTFEKEGEYQLSPRVRLQRGDLVHVSHLGKCTFIALVTNDAGDQWADVYKQGYRSVKLDRLKRRLKK